MQDTTKPTTTASASGGSRTRPETRTTAEYKGHTYSVNRETGYVEIDGQPVTVTNTDPEFWAKQYIDKTVALDAARTIPAEKPTAIHTEDILDDGPDGFEREDGSETHHGSVESERDAYKAHADKLAEALRDALKYADSATEHPENKAAFRRIIIQALAAYGTFAVANESEVQS